MTLTATDIQGADLSEPLVLFWHHHREGTWNKLATATLNWLSFIPDTLSYFTLLLDDLDRLEIGGRRRPALVPRLNTLRAAIAKEQPDVTPYIPYILSLACNWCIVY